MKLTLAILDTDRRGTAALDLVETAPSSEVEVLLVSADAGDPPDGVRMLQAYPLSTGYWKNRLLDAALGDVVLFVDRRVDASAVAQVLDAFTDQDTTAVIVPSRDSGDARAEEVVLRSLVGAGGPYVWAVRRAAAVAAGGFDVRPSGVVGAAVEDLPLLMTLLRRGGRLRTLGPGGVGVGLRPAISAERGRAIALALRRSRGRRMLLPYARTLLADRGRSAKVAELIATVRSLRRSEPALSPRWPLDAVPPAMRGALGDKPSPLRASPSPKTHLMWSMDPRQTLHLRVNPPPGLLTAHEDRERIRIRSGVDGIPRLLAAAEQPDALWLLEDRLPGHKPAPERAAKWFPLVSSWAVRMAGPPGPLLGTVDDWREFTAGVRDLLPSHAELLDRSFSVVETLPARHLHGDFQRRNILLDGAGVGAVDWDNAALESCPGFDLLFLALLAEADRPDPAVALDLLEGRDPPFGPLSSRLEAVGVARLVLAPAVAVMTAAWAAGEVRRLQRHRRPDGPRPFGELFAAVAAHPRLRAA